VRAWCYRPTARAQQLLSSVVAVESRDDVWVKDKQGHYWLFDFVCRRGEVKGTGKRDTPASLLLRACDAFAPRLCLGVPDERTLAVANSAPPRPGKLHNLQLRSPFLSLSISPPCSLFRIRCMLSHT
jgi:hypothetical protein